MGLHAKLRHNVEHVLDTRRVPWLRLRLAEDTVHRVR